MRTKTRAAGLLLAGLIAGWSAAEAATLKVPVAKTYPFQAGGELSLENVNGAVTITAWDRDEVRLEAEKIVKAGDEATAKQAMEKLQVFVDPKPGRLTIETRMPKRDDGVISWLAGRSVDMRVEYRLQVPRDLKLRVENVNGRVTTLGVGGELGITTVNGGVDVAEARGTLRAVTTNGGVKIARTSARIEAQSVNGGVDLDLDQVADDVSVSTTNGGITLRLPASAAVTIDASAVNGGVETDLAVATEGKQSRKRLKGTVNGGGAQVEASTVNGGVRIVEG